MLEAVNIGDFFQEFPMKYNILFPSLMQKIRSFFSYFVLFSLFFGIFAPVTVSFAWEDIYDYSEYSDKINISSESSLDGSITFDSPRTTFIVAFDGYIPNSSEDIEVEWNIDGKKYSHFLDRDWPDDHSRVTTFPRITEPRTKIGYRIINHTWSLPKSIILISSFQGSIGKRLLYDPDRYLLRASEPTPIVSRADWWADETLRYVSSAKRAKDRDDWIARDKTPKIIEETQAEYDRRIAWEKEFGAIFSSDPDARSTYSLKRYEWENKLFWPIRKTKKVDKIVVHHTAENLMQDADDKTLMRAIYLYHTKTKWWWDIGYNYVVWQRGQIYEWRAGGDYVEWAHVYGNNMGTVGISLIGNYETLHLNKDQKAGMLTAIEYVARKYGINLDEQSTWASLCGSWVGCIWKSLSTHRLIGHRDLWATSCPGKDLYSHLPEFRDTIVWKVWKLQPVYNDASNTIDPVDLESQIQYVIGLSTSQISPQSISEKSILSSSKIPSKVLVPSIQNLLRAPKIDSPLISRLPLGPEVKIKLSYPSEKNTIILESATRKNAFLLIWKRKLVLSSSAQVEITQSGSNMLVAKLWTKKYTANTFSVQSDIVRIPSWSRIPAWDTVGMYNDNVFRNRITIRNESGKLLVTNELPGENYLKGMGEVSESVDVKNYPEKVKALIVAGRSYVSYYQNPRLPLKERKFQTRLYDISDNPDESQVYKWYGYEMRSPNYAKLVESTNGEVVMYKGDLIKVWYFSSSDGRTLSYREYCESRWIKTCKDIPYLQSVPDPAWVGRGRSGHGVGISGIGATYGAMQGKSYRDIIGYYLTWVDIVQSQK